MRHNIEQMRLKIDAVPFSIITVIIRHDNTFILLSGRCWRGTFNGKTLISLSLSLCLSVSLSHSLSYSLSLSPRVWQEVVSASKSSRHVDLSKVRRLAIARPKLSGRISFSTALSQVCFGLPVLRRQSLGGPRIQAWRALEWPWLISAQQRQPMTSKPKLHYFDLLWICCTTSCTRNPSGKLKFPAA